MSSATSPVAPLTSISIPSRAPSTPVTNVSSTAGASSSSSAPSGAQSSHQALMAAADAGDAATVETLLDQLQKDLSDSLIWVLDLNRKDAAKGDTALIRASAKGHFAVVRLLALHAQVAVNATDDNQGWTALLWACYHGHDQVASFLADHPKVQFQPSKGWSALQCAAWNDHIFVVQYLLRKPTVQINWQRQPGGFTALHTACGRGHGDVVRSLLNRGPDIGLLDDHGRTAFDVAQQHGHAALQRLLQRHYDNPPKSATPAAPVSRVSARAGRRRASLNSADLSGASGEAATPATPANINLRLSNQENITAVVEKDADLLLKDPLAAPPITTAPSANPSKETTPAADGTTAAAPAPVPTLNENEPTTTATSGEDWVRRSELQAVQKECERLRDYCMTLETALQAMDRKVQQLSKKTNLLLLGSSTSASPATANGKGRTMSKAASQRNLLSSSSHGLSGSSVTSAPVTRRNSLTSAPITTVNVPKRRSMVKAASTRKLTNV